MLVLAFDHFFHQDLQALEAGLDAGDRLVSLPYRRLHKVALRHFGPDAFETLDAPFAPGNTKRWASFERDAARFTEWLDAAYQPSVFVVPNDGFFYLRPVIARFRELGVATVVVQKETTIAPLTMDEDSQVILRHTPFMADQMTVCSERHREFAVRTGAPPDKVVVTGQPRFDFYAEARARRTAGHGTRSILYLSYDDLSYLPADGSLGSWRVLRAETEQALAAVAADPSATVVVKHHPQQQARDDVLGDRAVRAARDADTRSLIAEADVVVGFQTTALFEAAVAGKPILYPAWGPVYERAAQLLIPFADHPELARHVRSPTELSALLAPATTLDPPGAAALATAEEHLGPVDGHATQRVLAVIRRHAHPHQVTGRLPDARQVVGALLRTAGAPLAAAAAVFLRIGRRPSLAAAASRHARYWWQEAAEGAQIIRRRMAQVAGRGGGGGRSPNR